LTVSTKDRLRRRYAPAPGIEPTGGGGGVARNPAVRDGQRPVGHSERARARRPNQRLRRRCFHLHSPRRTKKFSTEGRTYESKYKMTTTWVRSTPPADQPWAVVANAQTVSGTDQAGKQDSAAVSVDRISRPPPAAPSCDARFLIRQSDPGPRPVAAGTEPAGGKTLPP